MTNIVEKTKSELDAELTEACINLQRLLASNKALATTYVVQPKGKHLYCTFVRNAR